MTKIFYINGFGGGGPSPKVEALQAAFPGQVVAPYIPARIPYAMNAIKEALNNIDPLEEVIFVGTSLGAFWAAHVSNQYVCKAVLLNPSLRPYKTLAKYVGKEIDGEEWKMCDVQRYAHAEDIIDLNDGIPRIVLCEEGDTVINSSDVIEQLGMDQEYHAEFHLLPGGSHRFENYPAMIAAIKRLMNQEPH